jgi:hypothetical protein
MGKTGSKIVKVNPLYKRVDEVPEHKRDFVGAILEIIIANIKEEDKKVKKSNFDFSDLAGTLKLPKKFNAVEWQKQLRDEWER